MHIGPHIPECQRGRLLTGFKVVERHRRLVCEILRLAQLVKPQLIISACVVNRHASNGQGFRMDRP